MNRKKYCDDLFQHSTQMLWFVKRLTISVDRLKSDGLSPPEVAKMNEYAWKISLLYEQLRRIKEYDTPLALRAFARV